MPKVNKHTKRIITILKLGFLLAAVWLLKPAELDFQFNFNSPDIIPSTAEELSFGNALGGFLASLPLGASDAQPMNTSMLAPAASSSTSAPSENLSNTYSNMTYHTAQRTTSAVTKVKKQKAYVRRFAGVARSEMDRYGIPASITLAQGLIESNAGDSRLSRQNNNHFGMKCFSKRCSKDHCSNFTDDSHKDFFRKYNTSWESFRAHSLLLMGKRYRHLKKFGKDYKKWAWGLKKAGYATDKRYAQKLIHIIEELKLYEYDH